MYGLYNLFFNVLRDIENTIMYIGKIHQPLLL